MAANRSGLQMGAFDGGIMDALSQLSPPALQVHGLLWLGLRIVV